MRLLVLMLLFPAVCLADPWTTGDTVRQGAYTTLTVIDWMQTRWVSKHQHDCLPSYKGNCYIQETDPITSRLIGEHPSVGQVNNFFLATILLNAGVSYILPRGWRDGWQYISIGSELRATSRNYYIGVKMTY